MRVLVIEDEPDQLSALTQMFREEGFSVDNAGDGNVGLLLASSRSYDLIVLDWMLPGLDGQGVIAELRKTNSTPVLLLTARDTVEDRVKGLNAGADDYLTKPYSIAELLARVNALLRRNSRAPSDPERALGSATTAALASALSRLDSARQVQQRLQSARLPEIDGVDIAFDYQPAQWVGGDYCDVWKAPDGRLTFVIGDVSGKGVHAAIAMAGVHAALRASVEFCEGPAAIVAHLNVHLSRHLPDDMFVTLFLGMLDAVSGRCEYVNAGHLPPMLIEPTGSISCFAAPADTVLGIGDSSFLVETRHLPAGASILAVTDGVTEAVNASGERLGTERLRFLVGAAGATDPASLVKSVVRGVESFRGGTLPNDDLTALAVRFRGSESAMPPVLIKVKSNEDAPMRVLVIEDEPDLLPALAQALREEGYAIDTAADGREGLHKASTAAYDAVVLDVMLPKLDGWGVLRELRAGGTRVPVLLLTARDALGDRVRGLDAGADDYLTKPFELAELLARLRALIRRATGNATSTVELGDVVIDTSKKSVVRAGQAVALTAREYALVELLALHRGELVSRTMIYDHLFDEDDDSLSNLIDVHVSNIRKKLGRDFISTRRGQGYVLDDPVISPEGDPGV